MTREEVLWGEALRVLPIPIEHDSTDQCLADTEFGGERELRDVSGGVSLADLPHIVARQFPVWLTLLLRHIREVICLCSKKQVVWSDACADVASMANAQSLWDWSVRQLVRDAMSVFVLRSNRRSVAVVQGASPQPARVSLFDIGPECIGSERLLKLRPVRTGARAEPADASLQSRRVNVEFIPALLASRRLHTLSIQEILAVFP